MLIGDDPLAVQLLEELAWQQWCRYEVAYQAHRVLQDQADRLRAKWTFWVDPPSWTDGASSHSVTWTSARERARKQQRRTFEVFLATARHRRRRGLAQLGRKVASNSPEHWRTSAQSLHLLSRAVRGSCREPGVAEREPAPCFQSEPAHGRLGGPQGARAGRRMGSIAPPVVAGTRGRTPVAPDPGNRRSCGLGDAGPRLDAVRRSARWSSSKTALSTARRPHDWPKANPEDFVMVRDDATVGLEHLIATGAPFRFGGSLTRRLSGFDASCKAGGLLARLARQQQHGLQPQMLRRSPHRNTNVCRAPKITSRDWPALPDFFQEDNVRQHRELLRWFVSHGYRWITARCREQTGARGGHQNTTRGSRLRRIRPLERACGASGLDSCRTRASATTACAATPTCEAGRSSTCPFNQGLIDADHGAALGHRADRRTLVQLERQGRVKARQLE